MKMHCTLDNFSQQISTVLKHAIDVKKILVEKALLKPTPRDWFQKFYLKVSCLEQLEIRPKTVNTERTIFQSFFNGIVIISNMVVKPNFPF